MNILWNQIIFFGIIGILAVVGYVCIKRGSKWGCYACCALLLLITLGAFPFQLKTENPNETFENVSHYEKEEIPDKISIDKENFSVTIEKEFQELKKANQ